jgi:hypothetical protein
MVYSWLGWLILYPGLRELWNWMEFWRSRSHWDTVVLKKYNTYRSIYTSDKCIKCSSDRYTTFSTFIVQILCFHLEVVSNGNVDLLAQPCSDLARWLLREWPAWTLQRHYWLQCGLLATWRCRAEVALALWECWKPLCARRAWTDGIVGSCASPNRFVCVCVCVCVYLFVYYDQTYPDPDLRELWNWMELLEDRLLKIIQWNMKHETWR